MFGDVRQTLIQIFSEMRTARSKPRAPGELSGGYGGGVTPLPIPNREVKPSSAAGTARETVWERRSPPGVNRRAPRASGGPFLSVLHPDPRPDPTAPLPTLFTTRLHGAVPFRAP